MTTSTHQNIGIELLVTSIILSFFALLVVTARIYSRAWILKTIGWDDYALILAMLTAIGMTVVSCLNVHLGMGMHISDFGMKNLVQVMLQSYVFQLLYVICLGAVRTSLLLQLLRFAPSRRMTHSIYALLTITTLFSIAAFFSHALLCLLWRRFDRKHNYFGGVRCADYWTMTYTLSGVNLTMDFLVWLAPLNLVWKIRLPRPQKMGLIALFAIGALTWISAIARVVYADESKIPNLFVRDPTWFSVRMGIWATVETHSAIICSSLPTVRPFLRCLFPRIFGTTSNGPPTATLTISPSMHHLHTQLAAFPSPPQMPVRLMHASKRRSSYTEQFVHVYAGCELDLEHCGGLRIGSGGVEAATSYVSLTENEQLNRKVSPPVHSETQQEVTVQGEEHERRGGHVKSVGWG